MRKIYVALSLLVGFVAGYSVCAWRNAYCDYYDDEEDDFEDDFDGFGSNGARRTEPPGESEGRSYTELSPEGSGSTEAKGESVPAEGGDVPAGSCEENTSQDKGA